MEKKLSEDEKKNIEEAIKSAREKMEKADSKEEINKIKEELSTKAQKIGEIVYAEMQKQQAQQGAATGTSETKTRRKSKYYSNKMTVNL